MSSCPLPSSPCCPPRSNGSLPIPSWGGMTGWWPLTSQAHAFSGASPQESRQVSIRLLYPHYRISNIMKSTPYMSSWPLMGRSVTYPTRGFIPWRTNLTLNDLLHMQRSQASKPTPTLPGVDTSNGESSSEDTIVELGSVNIHLLGSRCCSEEMFRTELLRFCQHLTNITQTLSYHAKPVHYAGNGCRVISLRLPVLDIQIWFNLCEKTILSIFSKFSTTSVKVCHLCSCKALWDINDIICTWAVCADSLTYIV